MRVFLRNKGIFLNVGQFFFQDFILLNYKTYVILFLFIYLFFSQNNTFVLPSRRRFIKNILFFLILHFFSF